MSSANWPAVLGAGLFVLLGAIVGAVLSQELSREFERTLRSWDLTVLLGTRAEGRYARARNVLMSSGSTVFDQRWDEYIDRGVMTWDESFFSIRRGVKSLYPDLLPAIDSLNTAFGQVHDDLIKLRRRQGAKNQAVLADEEKASANAINALGNRLQRLLMSLPDG